MIIYLERGQNCFEIEKNRKTTTTEVALIFKIDLCRVQRIVHTNSFNKYPCLPCILIGMCNKIRFISTTWKYVLSILLIVLCADWPDKLDVYIALKLIIREGVEMYSSAQPIKTEMHSKINTYFVIFSLKIFISI